MTLLANKNALPDANPVAVPADEVKDENKAFHASPSYKPEPQTARLIVGCPCCGERMFITVQSLAKLEAIPA